MSVLQRCSYPRKMQNGIKSGGSLPFQVRSLGMHKAERFCELGKCGISKRYTRTGGKCCILSALVKISPDGQLSELIQFSANSRVAPGAGAELYQGATLLMRPESGHGGELLPLPAAALFH